MRFDETITVDAPIATVRAFFEDVVAVAECVPGIEDTRPISPNDYTSRMRIRLGLFSFTIAGRAHVEHGADGVWRMTAEGSDTRVSATVVLETRLREASPTTTEIQAAADLQIAGRLGGLGEPLIRRKAQSMLQDFTKNLSRALRARADAG